jgi:kynurenine formamidase
VTRRIDLSHEITDGMVTYPGIPAPRITTWLDFAASHEHYAPGTEFTIGLMELAANTGTYLDTPAHRHRGGWDLTGLPLDAVAAVPGVVVRCRELPGRAIPPARLDGLDLGGHAVLFATGWSRHWGTDHYFSEHPYLAPETVEVLVAAAPAVVGIDSLNIDGTDEGTRPAHTGLLGAGIPIVEHLASLDQLPDRGFTFFAVPPRVAGMATFPVRAFAIVEP